MGEEDNTAHQRSRSWLPQTHSNMLLLTHSSLTPPEKTLMVTDHDTWMQCKKPMVMGQHMDDAVQAARQLDAVWRKSVLSAKKCSKFCSQQPRTTFFQALPPLSCWQASTERCCTGRCLEWVKQACHAKCRVCRSLQSSLGPLSILT